MPPSPNDQADGGQNAQDPTLGHSKELRDELAEEAVLDSPGAATAASSSVGSSHSSADRATAVCPPLRYGFPEHHLASHGSWLTLLCSYCSCMHCLGVASRALAGWQVHVYMYMLHMRLRMQEPRWPGRWLWGSVRCELVFSMDMVFRVLADAGSRESVRRPCVCVRVILQGIKSIVTLYIYELCALARPGRGVRTACNTVRIYTLTLSTTADRAPRPLNVGTVRASYAAPNSGTLVAPRWLPGCV